MAMRVAELQPVIVFWRALEAVGTVYTACMVQTRLTIRLCGNSRYIAATLPLLHMSGTISGTHSMGLMTNADAPMLDAQSDTAHTEASCAGFQAKSEN